MGMEPLNNEKVNTNLLMETNEQNFAEIYQKCVWHSVETTPNIKKSNDFANLSRRYQLKIIERNQIKSFGLKLQSLTFVDSSSVEHGINYSTLSKNIQEKLKQVLYILNCPLLVTDCRYCQHNNQFTRHTSMPATGSSRLLTSAVCSCVY